MQVENLMRELLEELGDKPELRAKIDTLAMLQYQRRREGAQRAEHWELLARAEKIHAEQQAEMEELRKMAEDSKRQLEEARELRAAAERRMEELRAMEAGLLHRIPSEEERQASGQEPSGRPATRSNS